MLTLEKILEVVKSKYPDAFLDIEGGWITYIYKYKSKHSQGNEDIRLYATIEDKNINISDAESTFEYNLKNIIELKNYLDIEPTWDDIEEEVLEFFSEYKGFQWVISKNYISIFLNNIDRISYERLGNIKINKDDKIILILENLTLYQIHQQIMLKLDNLIKNLKENE